MKNLQQRALQTAGVLTKLMINLPKVTGHTKKWVLGNTMVNLYKYQKNGSIPIVSTMLSYCYGLGLNPGFTVMLADKIQKREITEEQAYEILARWPEFRESFETACDIAINRITTRSRKPVSQSTD